MDVDISSKIKIPFFILRNAYEKLFILLAVQHSFQIHQMEFQSSMFNVAAVPSYWWNNLIRTKLNMSKSLKKFSCMLLNFHGRQWWAWWAMNSSFFHGDRPMHSKSLLLTTFDKFFEESHEVHAMKSYAEPSATISMYIKVVVPRYRNQNFRNHFCISHSTAGTNLSSCGMEPLFTQLESYRVAGYKLSWVW